ncbi:ImmA/IrrE family metallo-endopeptidase [Helicobacter sp. faydin-H20]|uniref:ImmA/IrrE family metallo-endopeptidase n=1 Tax=Helicobacter anatolicus TaxID=2905874 RepID=UPI001E41D760|nr:ImmA/IrrE family metallo-endopeptidase [Helicobacter anatolicus]MCE3037472.1 ImmA/IrrE family metallo-endopeptidase [Helicobacter anatolicus]
MKNLQEFKKKFSGKKAVEVLEILEVTSIPIDIKDILRNKLGIHIDEKMEWDKLSFDGCVYLKDNYPEIWLNTSMPEGRQNFTLAHELGHIINDILPNIEQCHQDVIKDNYETLYRRGNTDKKEIRANQFAAEFLMPSQFIAQEAKAIVESKDFKELGLNEVIQRMADRFRVSFDAMKWRLVNLNYISKSKI